MARRKFKKLVYSPKLFFTDFVEKHRFYLNTSIKPSLAMLWDSYKNGNSDNLSVDELSTNFFLDYLQEFLCVHALQGYDCVNYVIAENKVIHFVKLLHFTAGIRRSEISILGLPNLFHDVRSSYYFSLEREIRNQSGCILYFRVKSDVRIISINLAVVKGNQFTIQKNGLSIKRCIINDTKLNIDAYDICANDFYPSFPIDAVYTWVNADDANWRDLVRNYTIENEIDWDRFRDHGELRYSLRSIDFFAKWIRRIFIVSNCSRPHYIPENSRIIWVDHSRIIDKEFLPTFNSHVIESFLWRIPGLAENFIYMNDDVFLNKRLAPSVFHTPNGCSVSHMEPYGMLNYLKQKSQEQQLEAWEAAALKGASLIESKFGVYPAQLHQHAPHSLKKSICNLMEGDFADEFRCLRTQRFRSTK